LIDIKVLASSSLGNCYHITDGHTPLLIECGVPFKKIQHGCRFRTSEIAGCLISHVHKDHFRAVQDVMKAGIDCWLSPDTKSALGIDSHRLHEFTPLKQFGIGSWQVKAFPLVHDVPNYGYLMVGSTGEKLIYLTDTAYSTYKFTGLTHIMCECNYSLDILQANVDSGALPVELKNRLMKTHFSLENVKEFLRANDLSKVWEIYLLHLSDGNSDADRFKREIQEFTGKPVIVAEQ